MRSFEVTLCGVIHLDDDREAHYQCLADAYGDTFEEAFTDHSGEWLVELVENGYIELNDLGEF